MLSKEIRREFLNYFKTQSHAIVPSSPVVPKDDPTLLFVNAGMNQFKDVFLGKDKRSYSRAATSQKCIRAGGKHNDLENVGHTPRHLTFFEMLGNFSFGDYFKKEAIGFAWDVSTHVFGFDGEKIWISVYKDDEEAFELWQKHVPMKRIIRLGEKDNFWSMGDVGPCGPCSELLYDRGDKFAEATSPLEDLSGNRFMEFWNLVFMQFNKETMKPLPKKSIDTGAGLERLVLLKMGASSIFQTDILRSLIAEAENISGQKYDLERESAPAFHVIADHIRSLSFAIADGAQPSNMERGYILRKILRRAARHGKMIGLNKPFLAKIASRLVKEMGEDFPELKSSEALIGEVLTIEEESFLKTLQRGDNLLSRILKRSKTKILGDDAFLLKDTYGFPIEEILLIAKDAHVEVDLKRFNELEEEAREKSRKAQKKLSEQFETNFFYDFAKTHKETNFIGYEKLESPATIQAIVIDGEFSDEIKEGQKGLLILDKTTFYAEKGGQAGDKGTIEKKDFLFEVENCQIPYGGIIAHIGEMKKGSLKKQDKVTAKVNKKRRESICNNHTATHLLHWALEKVLGAHIRQAGSLVEENYLRFDFTHHKAMSKEEIREVEELVNEKIRENVEIKTHILSLEEAQKRPEIKQFFGEKYETNVRMVDIDFSKELCGGTHVDTLGNIGFFKIEKESSIAAGVRRIEAVSGKMAEKLVQKREEEVELLHELLKTPKLKERIETLLTENRELTQELKKQRVKQYGLMRKELIEKKSKFGILAKVDICAKELSSFAEELMNELKSGLIVLAAIDKEKGLFIIKVGKDLIEKGIFANDLIKLIAPVIKGGGGGNKETAQAGGEASQIDKAFETIQNRFK